MIEEEITEEQWVRLREIRDEWIAIGLSTERCDRPAGEAGIRLAYECGGLPPPTHILWFDNPQAAADAYSRFEEFDADGQPIYGNRSRDWWRYVGGGAWAHWSAWVECHKYLGVTGLEIADGRTAASRNSWWWWALSDVAFICDRPTSIVSEQVAEAGWGSHRLHNQNGPAVSWLDGTNLYSWHGTTVPEWAIMDPTPERIMAEQNVEIRRAAIECLGWDKFIAVAGLALVDEHIDPHQGALYDVPDEIDDDPVRVLVVRNGTPEVDGTWPHYGITVPDTCETVREAQDWMAGVDDDLVLARRT